MEEISTPRSQGRTRQLDTTASPDGILARRQDPGLSIVPGWQNVNLEPADSTVAVAQRGHRPHPDDGIIQTSPLPSQTTELITPRISSFPISGADAASYERRTSQPPPQTSQSEPAADVVRSITVTEIILQIQNSKVDINSPCSKILPAVLGKYPIAGDWTLHVLFICYKTTYRCLALDEKPLLLFKKLKKLGTTASFRLRHVKDIPSPMSIARKRLVKKANSKHEMASRTGRVIPSPEESIDGAKTTGDSSGRGLGHTYAFILWTGIAYAVAIHPYDAGHDDEFDVMVGATFIVLRRSKGWWEVQEVPFGSGDVGDGVKKGWVPSGLLLETTVPPATAAIETATFGNVKPDALETFPTPSDTFASDAPILPSRIVSPSEAGVALMDWLPQGDYQLDLGQGDSLRVYKYFNHWSYVAKQSGRRGWVPRWLIGRA
jgi:hypothetical protein